MKRFLINNYALLVLILSIIYNLLLRNLIVSGSLYLLLMAILTILNVVALIKFKKSIKYKTAVLMVLFIIWLIIAKNAAQCIFTLSTIITLAIIGLKETKLYKVLSVFTLIFLVALSYPIFIAYIANFGTHINIDRSRRNIYNSTQYYCEDHTEIYKFSTGAWDKFHYSVGKAYEILNIDGIIYVSYNIRNEVSEEDYDSFLNNHECEQTNHAFKSN